MTTMPNIDFHQVYMVRVCQVQGKVLTTQCVCVCYAPVPCESPCQHRIVADLSGIWQHVSALTKLKQGEVVSNSNVADLPGSKLLRIKAADKKHASYRPGTLQFVFRLY